MTEASNLPAMRTEVAPAVPDTDSWTAVVDQVARLASNIAGTEFVPRALRDKPAAVAAAILYGREVGLAPMTALTQTHVIEGKPAISAEGMRALVLAAGHSIEVAETTGGVCTMRARRRGSETWTSLTWSLDMARAAGLAGKAVWKSYPRQMLQARCTAELVRLVFPDVIHGFRAAEELDDTPELEPPAAVAEPGTTVVRRQRATKKAAGAHSQAPVAERQAPPSQGLPLPGEDGYESLVPSAAGDGAGAPPSPAPTPDGPSAVDASASPPEVPASPPAAEGSSDEPFVDEEVPLHHPDLDERGLCRGCDRPADDRVHVVPDRASRGQLQRLNIAFNGLGIRGATEDVRHDRLRLVGRIVGVEDLQSTSDLTPAQASAVIDTLARVQTRSQLEALLAAQEADVDDLEAAIRKAEGRS